jgi:hypothetical protein
MPPTDDARSHILGRVQELRAEIARVRDRTHARDIKRQVLELREWAHFDGAAEELPGIIEAFVEEARATLVVILGTSAWDEPPTLDEALRKFKPTPPAPGSEQPPLTDEELARIWGRATRHHVSEDDLWALLRENRRLRSDAWLEQSAKEILGEPPVCECGVGADECMCARAEWFRRQGRAVSILRKHRDGKA